ncbi:TonB-linked outer membrane protein, SusC/RagA family [Chitinophaga terrae (ex Kim and Jung 2007)]|uniref:TonB-linked outer membrane protein, SusC/RagA family n=1 Tax=Chitinophaga terrae (ex Kim and Jung 2007) TaxID=408074 RepID=A0A1H4ESR2_9BACT|nr:TonB-dependent receptor [Chitinophaga terrae (ex Kim and Jung 2007)]SEA87919.1 TonB-linked outer membrane protein, SusC/RagA family [Chitinophaga terrae (ex Kim and Jung 2007)]
MKRFLTMIFLGIAIHGFAQQKKVGGLVTDKNTRTPVIGATVISQKQTVTTDSTGHFSLAAEANELITISCIGMNTIRVPVPASGQIVAELSANISDLNQVVITGYQTQRKADLTGAVSVVNVGDLKKQAVANPVKALQGQVSGVFITSSGSPSAPVTVRIRGVGTLNDNDPLYIIDGVPTKAGLHELNSSDIETMQVLKDASAASIYGARAANGVIIITTKQGRSGRMQVNVNAYTAVQTYTTKPKMLNAGGYGQAYWQAAVNTGRDPNANSIGYNFQWHADDNGTPVLDKILLPEYIDGDRRTMRTSNTNWFDEISQTGIVQSYDLSVTNGTENGSYLFSVGYFDNKGVIKTTNFNRLSARMNANYKLLKGRLQVGENFTINRTKEVQDPGVLNLSLQALPIVPVHTVDGIGWGGPWGGMNDRQNPVRLLMDNQQNGYKYLRLFGNVYADLSIIPGLNLRTSAGIDYGNYLADNFLKKYQSGYLVGNENQLTMNYSNSSRVTWTNTLNYNRTIGKHLVNAVLGTEFYKQNDLSFWASRKNYAIEDPNYTYLDAGTGEKNNGGGGAINALMSYFGKVNYTYDSRYLASFTIRRDGSSRFGIHNQFGTFPAFSLGWRVSQEEFFRKNAPSFISDLKLRYGWGQTGNQEISNVGAYSIYVTDYNGTSYDIAGANTGTLPSGYHITQRGNDNLKWEATTMSNYGIDVGFWEQKLTGSFEYFTKKTSDILVLPPYIAVLGEAGNQWVNGASMENRGWEAALTYNGSIGEVEFQVSGNISGYKNKVTKLPESVVNNYGGNGLDDNILGRPVNSYYGYVTDGLFRTQKEVDESARQLGKGLGRIRYKDLNDDGVIDDRDRTWIGAPHPDFIYGLNLAVQWKGFDLSAFFQGVQGNAVINDVKYNTDFWSVRETGSNKGSRLLNAWSPQNPNSSIPAISATDDNFESRFSTYFIERGDYLKLRNIQLGYTFPKQLLNRLSIQKLRVYVGGDNVWLVHKNKSFTGLDPENPGFGYPNPVVFTGGVSVTF